MDPGFSGEGRGVIPSAEGDGATLKPTLIRVDLHVHSAASFDCRVVPEMVAARCAALGLAPVFLTDHDSIEGATSLRNRGAGRVVIGEEVMTREGELIGLFLKRPIRPGLPARDVVTEIKSQGGIVYLEHPYDATRRHLNEDAIESIRDGIDIVEIFNGRSDTKANLRAADLCEILGAAPGAGSDAHSLKEIGSVYIEMEDFDGPVDFLENLRRSRIVRRPNIAWLRARTKLADVLSSR